MSAMKAGVTRKTAGKYLKLGDPHDSPRVAHGWLTRPDEFAGVWPEVEAMLTGAPELEALSVFELLVSRHPGPLSTWAASDFSTPGAAVALFAWS